MPQLMPDKIQIAIPPIGAKVSCPATVIGRGLAVAQLPYRRQRGGIGYSVTHIATGKRLLDGIFSCQAIAKRCAQELIRACSFEAKTDEEIMQQIRPAVMEFIRPILDRYLDLDDAWQDRQTIAGG